MFFFETIAAVFAPPSKAEPINWSWSSAPLYLPHPSAVFYQRFQLSKRKNYFRRIKRASKEKAHCSCLCLAKKKISSTNFAKSKQKTGRRLSRSLSLSLSPFLQWVGFVRFFIVFVLQKQKSFQSRPTSLHSLWTR